MREVQLVEQPSLQAPLIPGKVHFTSIRTGTTQRMHLPSGTEAICVPSRPRAI
jgi:hypothetical protein